MREKVKFLKNIPTAKKPNCVKAAKGEYGYIKRKAPFVSVYVDWRKSPITKVNINDLEIIEP